MSLEREAVAVPFGAAGVPATLGDYRLLAKLASGGMATVYVARKHAVAGFERLLAIKCCHPHLREDEEFAAMFLDEARLAAGIRHPNVVATLDVHDAEQLYLVMEYIEGSSLGNLLKEAAQRRARMPAGVVLRVMIDVLSGLHAAHELRDANGVWLGLVHRDVSPQNILIGVDGIARITDFGIAFASARSSVTQEGRIKGKFSYLAPEQAKSQRATCRMDVFSAGTVLWEALTGRALFRKKDDAATIAAVLGATVPPPSSLVAGLPSALDRIVLKALERDPERRYQSAAEFAQALESVAIEGMNGRAVSAYVEQAWGKKLAERREAIRLAPELVSSPYTPAEARGRTASLRAPSSDPAATSGFRWNHAAAPAAALVPPASEDIQHRRLRGILAAAMLLLVGSAIGLLLARSNAGVRDGAVPAPSAQAPPTTR